MYLMYPAANMCMCVCVLYSISYHWIIVDGVVQGNKKGPVKRWDFDTEDAYSEYQSRREAMPK